MANTASAKKALRVTERRTVINLRRRRVMREARNAVLKAVSKGDKKLAQSLVPAAYQAIDKASKTNIIHENTAARYKSRLVAKVKALA